MRDTEPIANIMPRSRIERRIFWLRGEKVMLDSDLAELYEIPTKRLIEQVKRNKERFPDDFMLQLTNAEMVILRSQIATSSKEEGSHGGRRYNAYAFTESGVAMLSSVLRSERAVAVNIQIMRTFIALRTLLMTHEVLRKKIEILERKYDSQLREVFGVLRQLIKEETEPKKKIGFVDRNK